MDPYLLGVPGTGFHATRIFGLALYDIVGTILLAWGFTYFTEVAFWKSLVGMFVLGEFLHYIFGTPTAIMNFFTGKE
jgi:hypothetical protein